MPQHLSRTTTVAVQEISALLLPNNNLLMQPIDNLQFPSYMYIHTNLLVISVNLVHVL